MAKRRKSRKKSPVAIIILVVVLMALSSFLTFKAVYNCDHCGKLSVGAGYQPNTLTGLVTAEKRICEDCARAEHDSILSKDIEEYKLTIEWFEINKPVDNK